MQQILRSWHSQSVFMSAYTDLTAFSEMIFGDSCVKFWSKIHCIPYIFYNREWPLRLTFIYFHQLNVRFLWSNWYQKINFCSVSTDLQEVKISILSDISFFFFLYVTIGTHFISSNRKFHRIEPFWRMLLKSYQFLIWRCNEGLRRPITKI